MELVLKTFAACPEHRSSDSTFLVFMFHGILDRICGTMHNDGKSDVLSYDTTFQIFNNRNCCHLRDKPKVIIIQACRGGEFWWGPEDREVCVTQGHTGCFISSKNPVPHFTVIIPNIFLWQDYLVATIKKLVYK